MEKRIGSCTTILVGKKASLDGSTLIARNEDAFGQSNPQKFVVITPDQQPNIFHSVVTNIDIPLPDNPLRYTATPDSDDSEGVWGASGINSANVAMTATETITTNIRVQSIDPFVENGIGEADLLTIVLPYIHSAKEGVLRLGSLLKKYGTYEPNAIAFSDKNEIWYLETLGGHHWAAIKIPDASYVVAPNRLNIDNFDFNSSDTLYSDDLPDMIKKYQLNPDFEGVNLRHIFGSSSEKDTIYNNPRAWYIQKHFNPSISDKISPEDQDLPFICYPEKKISIEDIKWALSSHFQNTPFDPYGNGTKIEKKLYRPIGINRNQEAHILQIRSNVPDEIAGIHWLAFGPNTFNAMVPFYTMIEETPAIYNSAVHEFDPTTVYWLTRVVAVIGDANYHLYSDLVNDYELKTMAACKQLHYAIDDKALTHQMTIAELEEANQKMANISLENLKKLLYEMVQVGTLNMNLRFTLND